MYHCFVHIYMVGLDRSDAEALKGMPPFRHFAHSFTESSQPDLSLAGRADVILADLRGPGGYAVLPSLLEAKQDGAQIILMAAPV